MKKNDKKEIFAKDLKTLKTLANEARKQLFEMKIDHSQNKLKNTTQISEKRHELARLLTVIKEKELAGEINKV
ncbi:MAG: 50S ribosomal protein L29 [Microgenomates group bacterium GW2011_GWC1_38_14]|nr:MAG: 50S ribosomal protein L29 [Candidatus Levybacteria bacterium GW2011_GWA2_36_13]KKQ00797.1 MAG: 50S ribosomal protein L29 [Candidatus Levybacteria bacterium GW2011_GWB1_36_18]KKQ58302.1 MAG: 50S ribosomal protein L29 [Microgenomates group bacterium GW2011_GWC1_38_14]KKR15895.1 MAG: 50S ribosomal protein L29 [Candidatus Levybacteria bacterium GW2011_GWA1_39_32]OGH43837.1 MAG: 50S ribosomal protein L29 [Candidatus Levybacteria bacterium RIFCSPLOWO2_02_FULL_37_11]